jgi:hypothetical protein
MVARHGLGSLIDEGCVCVMGGIHRVAPIVKHFYGCYASLLKEMRHAWYDKDFHSGRHSPAQ